MKRRDFISHGAILTSGTLITGKIALIDPLLLSETNITDIINIYELFKNPPLIYHPFVRWWWNGNKIEAKELIRELRLLKEAGIGGVEINPIEFPKRYEGDDLESAL